MYSSRFVTLLLLPLACWLTTVVVAQPCHSQIRINEILAAPASDWNGDATVSSRDDEWVEIVNAGAAAVALDDLRLSDGGTSVTYRFGFSGTLAPGEVRVVFGNQSVAWESANGVSSVGLSLNNAGDAVRLWQVTATDTLLVDSYTYASFEVLSDRSTGRMPDGGDTWHVFDALNPYTGTTPPLGTGCHPSPGNSNSCPTPVEPATWSDVKQLYDAGRRTPGR